MDIPSNEDVLDAVDQSDVRDENVDVVGDSVDDSFVLLDVHNDASGGSIDVLGDAMVDVHPDTMSDASDRDDVFAPCASGLVRIDGTCVPVAPPRLVAPLSTSRVTSRTPRLRWALPPGVEGARIELCQDRSCTSVATRFDVTGTTGTVPVGLTAGTWFWRARGLRGGVASDATSATWQLFAPRVGTRINTAWGASADYNGDGLADLLAVARSTITGRAQMLLYPGARSGLVSSPVVTPVAPSEGVLGFFQSLQNTGDLDGDGFPEVLVIMSSTADSSRFTEAVVFRGGSAGIGTLPAHGYRPLNRLVAGIFRAGDVDGDGLGDLLMDDMLSRSRSGAWPTDLRRTLELGSVVLGGALNDMNGDGLGEVFVSTAALSDGGRVSETRVYHGAAGGLADSPAGVWRGTGAPRPLGDVDCDGYADFALPDGSGISSVLVRGGSGAPISGAMIPTPLVPVGDIDGDGCDDVLHVTVSETRLLFGFATNPFAFGQTLRTQTGEALLSSHVRESTSPGDINGDGAADVVVTTVRGDVLVYNGAPIAELSRPSQVISVPADLVASFVIVKSDL
jgi:hypothetical protein